MISVNFIAISSWPKLIVLIKQRKPLPIKDLPHYQLLIIHYQLLIAYDSAFKQV